jgi:hypothetical protein
MANMLEKVWLPESCEQRLQSPDFAPFKFEAVRLHVVRPLATSTSDFLISTYIFP